MVKAIGGTYENGEITLLEIPPISKSRVIVVFLEKSSSEAQDMPDDFERSLDDENEQRK